MYCFKCSLIYMYNQYKASKTKICMGSNTVTCKKNEATCEKTRCCWMRKTKAQNCPASAQSGQRLRYSHSAKFDS